MYVEVPPSIAQAASAYVKNSIGTIDHKMVFMEANHAKFINQNTTDNEGIYNVPQYLSTMSPNDTRDVFFDGSYYKFINSTWMNSNYNSALASSSYHYLGKFPSIDYERGFANEVHAIIADYVCEDYGSNTAQTQFSYNNPSSGLLWHVHSHGTIPNANWLWFQAYTSIIHGVKGVWFWDFNSWDPSEIQSGKKNNFNNQSNPARFNLRSNFPSIYENYVSNLAREIRYLVKKDIISSDLSNIIYSKTTTADANCIVPAAGGNSYILNALNSAGLGGNPSIVSEMCTENYGLRYTIRTNGSEVYMIVTNPLGISIPAVNLNFSGLGNQIIQNATGVEVLFDGNQFAYNSTSYKVNRNSTINLSAMTVGSKYPINFSAGKQLTNIAFGPLDVKVFRFISTVPNYNNGWDLAWTNNGNDNIGGYYIANSDLIYHADLDGDGTDELLCTQYNPSSNNDWMTLLKFNNTTQEWVWTWSNYGSNATGLYPYRFNFYVGDFDGDGSEELLGNDNSTPGSWTTLFKWQNGAWVWTWSDYGSSTHAIRPYKEKMYTGDFNGDGKDEILACDLPGGWTTEFKWSGNDFVWGWSDYGNHPLTQYRNDLYPGDYNGDGATDLVGFSSSNAEMFEYNGNWNSTWNNNGANNFGGWTFPPGANDKILTGNIDTDAKDELVFIQTGVNASWATSFDFSSSAWNWNWSANPMVQSGPFIDDWALNPNGATDNRYFILKPVSANPEYLMTLRNPGCTHIVNMYQINTSGNYKNQAIGVGIKDISKEKNILVYPNPTSGSLHLELDGEYEVKILDNVGRTVFHNTYNKATELNLTEFKGGLYLVVLKNDSGTITKKIIVEK
jgi:hypothetical protein